MEPLPATRLPLYHYALDWDALYREYPPPDVWAETIFKWPAERIRELQNRRFLDMMKIGWANGFYRQRWSAAGLKPGDIRGLDDIVKLPTFNSDDIKASQQADPPFGQITGIDLKRELQRNPIKMQTSGGTTGKARPTLYGALEWEMNGMQVARTMYMQGARPGDVLQIPATASLANLAWCYYKAAHDYLGIMPLTTGSGVVTPSRKQLELMWDYGVNILMSFPEYLTQLAKVAQEELHRNVADLKLKFIPTYLGPDTENVLRSELERLYGCDAFDNYGTHEISNAAFEGPEKDGMYLIEDCIYLEVIDVETGQPLGPGQPGNLVATSLFRRIPPIIRFNLRDLAALRPPGRSVLGSEFRRIGKFLGRSDDMVKLRATNVYPMACLSAVRSDPRTTGEWLCVVDRHTEGGAIRDEMVVRVEVRRTAGGTEGLAEAIAKRLAVDLGVRVGVELVPEGSLAEAANLGREGKARRLLDRRFKKA